jgi:hypothetical protein
MHPSLHESDLVNIDAIRVFDEILLQITFVGNKPNLYRLFQLVAIENARKARDLTDRASMPTVAGLVNFTTFDFDEANRFTNLSVRLVKEGLEPMWDAKATTLLNMFLLHWRRPYHECLEALARSSEVLDGGGNLEMHFYSVLGYGTP